MKQLIVLGAGGHGRVVADAARASGWAVLAFADSAKAGQTLMGLPVTNGEPEALAEVAMARGAQVVVALGDNRARQVAQLALTDLGVELATVVHPSATLLSGVTLGAGAMVLARAVLGLDSQVGRGAIINTSVSLDHDNQIGDFAHLSPGVRTGGEVRIGEGVHLAVGVSVRNRTHVGDWTIVGVGAAVVTNLPSRVVAYGVPARPVRAQS